MGEVNHGYGDDGGTILAIIEDEKINKQIVALAQSNTSTDVPTDIQDSTDHEEDDAQNVSECWGARHTLAILAFLGMASVYTMRVNLSIAIVAMVKAKSENSSIETNDTLICPYPEDYDPGESEVVEGDFNWDKETQGLILGSFFYGYATTNFLGGIAAEYFGGKLVFGLGIVLTAALTLLSPIAASQSTGLFVALRIAEGCTEGVTMPSMNYLLSCWVPKKEKSKFSGFVWAGLQFGTVITLPISGWLCNTTFMGGWPSVFYIFGGLGIIWGFFWFPLIRDRPQDHPRISKAELRYITANITHGHNEKKVPPPWLSIVTSLPFLSVVVMQFGHNWGFYTLLTEMPTYLDNIQHFDMESNGLMSALPYFCMMVFSILWGQVIDVMTRANVLSLTNLRRLSQVIGTGLPMVFMIVLCFIGCDPTGAVIVLCLAVGFNGAVNSGFINSHADLAPRYAGTLLGITNTIGTIPGFVAPALVGALINDDVTIAGWNSVFGITASIYLVTTVIYIIFITSEQQDWANGNKIKNSKDVDEKQS